MHTPLLCLATFGFVACLSCALSAAAPEKLPESHIKAGFAERDITPSLGMEQPGGYGKAFHRSFHDACKVRAAVFDDGKKRVALVGLDALMIPRTLVLAAREDIAKQCGIPGDCVMIGASHSHSSGPIGMVQPGEFDGADELVKKLAYQESSCADAGYLLTVRKAITDAVVWADKIKEPALLGFGSGHEDKVSFNRRHRMKDGTTYTHPGVGNPDMLEYAGPIDPEVGVIAAWDLHGGLLGVMVNFSCHATAGPGGISANWIYYLEETIQGATQSRAPVVFLQGACGDITQVDNLNPYKRPEAEEWSRRVGGRVGAEAVKTMLLMTKSGEIDVDSRDKIWKIKRRPPSPEHLAKSLEIVKQPKPTGDTTEWLFAKEIVMLDNLIQREPEPEQEVQAIQVGPAVFVSNPAEYFVENGLRIKKESPFPLTWVVELADGCAGYVPTEEAFGPHGGGYETRLTLYSNLEITAGTQFADVGIELAKAMTPQKVPEPPKLLISGKAWRYGSVPPELK
jgi:neutral ceramidase